MNLFAPERLPYCGAPPAPGSLWQTWNLDPILIAILVGLGLAYAAWRGDDQARRRGCAGAGWAILSLALISPLCPLSVSLFSARVGQHMILTLVAAPLLALGAPPRTSAGRPIAAAAAFGLALWLWHAPRPYDLTFVSTAIYWAMHLSLIGAAVWLWRELLSPRAMAGKVIAAALIAMVAMSLLGALITLAPRALYAPHLLTASAWGLTPLQDQQLGGAIMWVPGGLVFLAAALAAAGRALAARTPAPAGSHR